MTLAARLYTQAALIGIDVIRQVLAAAAAPRVVCNQRGDCYYQTSNNITLMNTNDRENFFTEQ